MILVLMNAPNTASRTITGIIMQPNPAKVRRGQGGGTAVLGDGVRTPCGQSGSLRGLKLVPSNWRYLILPMLRNTPQKACGA